MAFDIKSALGSKIGGVPTWILVVGGGVALALFAPKLLSKFTGGGSSAQGGPTDNTGTPGVSNNLPDTIDPITGIPYAVEEAIDPNTGLPVYMTLYNGGSITQAPNPNPIPTPASNPSPPPASPLPQQGAGSGVVSPGQPVSPSVPGAVPFAPGRTGSSTTGTVPGASPLPQMPQRPTAPPSGVPPAAPLPQPGRGPRPPGASPYPQGGRFVHPLPWPASQSTLSGIATAHGVPLARLEQLNPWIAQERGSYNLIYATDNIRIA